MTTVTESDRNRLAAYRKDPEYESRLHRLNEQLAPLEEEATRSFGEPRLPMVFVVGAPRSGSTLFAQILAASGRFSYVSNFTARLWMAPYLGMLIERGIGPFDEMISRSFRSDVGVTDGWRGPHEFGYFWSRWFPFGVTHKLEATQLEAIDSGRLARECAAMESVEEKPLFFKNLTCGLQMEFLAGQFPQSVFVVMERDPLYTMQSLLLAREEVYGDRNVWLSLRPREYPALVDRSPLEQVAGQVHFTLHDITTAAARLEPHRSITIEYEAMCADPRAQLHRVERAVGVEPLADGDGEHIPAELQNRNQPRLPASELESLRAAAGQFSEA